MENGLWDTPLVAGTLIRRYKRFLSDVALDDGGIVTAHCPNTGAMTGCDEPGARVWLSVSDNPRRKYRHTWELVETPTGMACIHSALANKVARRAVMQGRIRELRHFTGVSTEVKYGEGSRIDLLLHGERDCYVEVKSVTLALGGGLGVFPDAVSERGARHLRELVAVRRQGPRAVLLFAVFHGGIERVAPADAIDPVYGDTLREAMAAGVEVLAYGAEIGPAGISLRRPLPVLARQP